MKKAVIFCVMFLNAAVFAQDLPAVSVYVTGSIAFEDAKTVSKFMTASLVKSGRYRGIERPDAFIIELNDELLKNSGGAGENPVCAVGKRFGARYVCIAQVTPIFDMVEVFAYIMDVETAGVILSGEALGAVKAVTDFMALSERAVEKMLPKPTVPQAQTAPEIQVAPQTQAPPQVQIAPQTQAAPETAVPQSPPPPAVLPAAPKMDYAENVTYAKAEPVKHNEAKEPKAESGKPQERGSWFSVGAGGCFLNDFGGGVEWGSGERMAMPYYGKGAYLFLDAAYAEISAGYAGGSGKWLSASVSNKGGLPTMRREYVNFGLLAKYPFSWGIVKYFPLLGVDYGLSVSGRVETAGGYDYEFDGGSGEGGDWRGERPGSDALSALWFKFGGGVDIDLGSRLYLRIAALYGLRDANGFESGLIDGSFGYDSGGSLKSALTGHGIDLKIGLGFKI